MGLREPDRRRASTRRFGFGFGFGADVSMRLRGVILRPVTVLLVVVSVSAALILGAAWGVYAPFPDRVEGAVLAFAGGALITSLSFELIEPAAQSTSVRWTCVFLLVGAATFSAIDYVIDERWGSDNGGGILAAVTLDGVPENLALGVALIGASVGEVAALAAAIFASNLPEAAGGASGLAESGWSKRRTMGLWVLTAALLSAAALVGYGFFDSASDRTLAAIRSFAAGAVIASLATEVFPKAFRDARNEVGIAVAVGFVAAFALI